MKPKDRRAWKLLGLTGHMQAIRSGIEHLFKPRMTVLYPEVLQDLGPNYRGMLKLHIGICISCTLCARICPSNALKMVKVDVRKYPGITYQRCIFCGFCVDICPVDALEMSGSHDAACYTLGEQVLKPEDFSKDPVIEDKPRVKPLFDEKRGLRYESC